MTAARRGGKRVGYIRVSSVDQNTERQLNDKELALDKVYEDKCSGKGTKRPQLQAALGYLREGDVLVVHSMDRLSRNMRDLQNLVADLTSRGIAVEFRNPYLVFTGSDDKMANLLLSMLGAVAELERALLKERQKEGIEIAKAKGVYKGRKPSLTPDRVAELRSRATAGEKKAGLAREFGVSRETVYQYLRGE